jgi:hypothetical protein
MKRLLLLAALATGLGYAQNTPIVQVYNNPAVTTLVTAKSTSGNLHGWLIYNPNASLCYLQIFNTASTATLGTTKEMLNIPVLPTNIQNLTTNLVQFSVGISIASTTGAHGSTTCATGLVVALFYN